MEKSTKKIVLDIIAKAADDIWDESKKRELSQEASEIKSISGKIHDLRREIEKEFEKKKVLPKCHRGAEAVICSYLLLSTKECGWKNDKHGCWIDKKEKREGKKILGE